MALNNQNGNGNGNGASYTAADIQVLEGLEAVRKRPGMYIGSTDQRGLHHLVYEIAYNSVDEAMSGTCDRIAIAISEDNIVTVEDNGRGIPVEIHPTTKSLRPADGHDRAARRRQVRRQGLPGLRRPARRGRLGGQCPLRMDEGRPSSATASNTSRSTSAACPSAPVKEVGRAEGTGTITSFLADKQIFTEIEYDFDTLADRIREMAYLNRALEISFDDRRHGQEQTYLLRGRHHRLRPAPQPQQAGHPPPSHLHDQAGRPHHRGGGHTV